MDLQASSKVSFMFTSASAHTMFECPSGPLAMERRWKSNLESAPNCPRCTSANTKFCYYNNYSLSQPRYFCKGCRRYWTKGGSLRNLPVGGGCRKSRRTKSCRQADRPGSQIPNPGSTGDESNNATNGTDIDLAAVFAKFLNQDNSINDVDKINVSSDQDSSSSGVSYTSQDLPLGSLDTENQLENMIFQCQKPTDIIERDQVQEGIPPLCIDAEKIEELLDQNANAFELQAILGEDIGNDAVLSDGISLPNFEWQSFMNFQDFGSSFSTDDDLKIPLNLADDNWSSSDVSAGYEIFSSPWN